MAICVKNCVFFLLHEMGAKSFEAEEGSHGLSCVDVVMDKLSEEGPSSLWIWGPVTSEILEKDNFHCSFKSALTLV